MTLGAFRRSFSRVFFLSLGSPLARPGPLKRIVWVDEIHPIFGLIVEGWEKKKTPFQKGREVVFISPFGVFPKIRGNYPKLELMIWG